MQTTEEIRNGEMISCKGGCGAMLWAEAHVDFCRACDAARIGELVLEYISVKRKTETLEEKRRDMSHALSLAERFIAGCKDNAEEPKPGTFSGFDETITDIIRWSRERDRLKSALVDLFCSTDYDKKSARF